MVCEKLNISYTLEDSLAKYRVAFLSLNKTCKYYKGEYITLSGDMTNSVYFLLKGIVRISTVNINGYERIIGFHKKNTLFAMDAICFNHKAVVNTQCVSEVMAVKVNEDDMKKLCLKYPGLAYDLVQYYGMVLRLMCFDAENNSIQDVKKRLITWLCLYYENSDVNNTILKATQAELASIINASRVQTARILNELKKDKLIELKRGYLIIKNYNNLKKQSLK